VVENLLNQGLERSFVPLWLEGIKINIYVTRGDLDAVNKG
jgi:hypothetical protein